MASLEEIHEREQFRSRVKEAVDEVEQIRKRFEIELDAAHWRLSELRSQCKHDPGDISAVELNDRIGSYCNLCGQEFPR